MNNNQFEHSVDEKVFKTFLDTVNAYNEKTGTFLAASDIIKQAWIDGMQYGLIIGKVNNQVEHNLECGYSHYIGDDRHYLPYEEKSENAD